MYLLTLVSPMSMPSLSNSPWMRGAPQVGFSRHILWIRSRTSRGIFGLPGWPRRTFQLQKRRKLLRCQAITVSGRTITSTERQSLQMRDSQTHKSRSPAVSARAQDRRESGEQCREKNEHRERAVARRQLKRSPVITEMVAGPPHSAYRGWVQTATRCWSTNGSGGERMWKRQDSDPVT